MIQNQLISILLRDFTSLFFPNYCSSCNRTLSPNEEFICLHCRATIHEANLHLFQPNLLHQKFYEIPDLRYAFVYAWFQQKGVLQQLLHALKYKGQEQIGLFLGQLYGNILVKHNYHHTIDFITSVPLHYVKYRKRGYNQSDLIAKGLSEVMGVPFKRLIKKKYNRKSQTKKQRSERFSNVENTFAFLGRQRIANKHILVVDDVLTTGATIQAACQPLIEKTATVSIFTVAAVK